jgi:hypothetical protein
VAYYPIYISIGVSGKWHRILADYFSGSIIINCGTLPTSTWIVVATSSLWARSIVITREIIRIAPCIFPTISTLLFSTDHTARVISTLHESNTKQLSVWSIAWIETVYNFKAHTDWHASTLGAIELFFSSGISCHSETETIFVSRARLSCSCRSSSLTNSVPNLIKKDVGTFSTFIFITTYRLVTICDVTGRTTFNFDFSIRTKVLATNYTTLSIVTDDRTNASGHSVQVTRIEAIKNVVTFTI